MTQHHDSLYGRMLALMQERYPNYADLWKSTRDEFGEVWEREFNRTMGAVFGSTELRWESAIDGYAEFCTDALRSQIFFEKFGRYKISSYAEAAEEYYHNPEFMFRSYLPGMILSHYLWPHHHRMLRYFRGLMDGLRDQVATFSEVGTGCGMYSQEALELFPQASGTGFDISQSALEFTKQVVDACGTGGRYVTQQQDILLQPPAPVDLVLNQEVLEHLEDPEGFLRGLFAMTLPGGYGYIAAAVNAGHVDHIYLYRSPEEIVSSDRERRIRDSRLARGIRLRGQTARADAMSRGLPVPEARLMCP